MYGIIFFNLMYFSETQYFHTWNKNLLSRTLICEHLGILPRSCAKNWRNISSKFRNALIRSISLTSEVSRLNAVYELLMCTVWRTYVLVEDMTRGSGGHQSCLPSPPSVPALWPITHSQLYINIALWPPWPSDMNYWSSCNKVQLRLMSVTSS